MDEALVGARPDIDESSYVVGTRECSACKALERHRAIRAKADEKAYGKTGENPNTWRLDQVDLLEEARERARRQNT